MRIAPVQNNITFQKLILKQKNGVNIPENLTCDCSKNSNITLKEQRYNYQNNYDVDFYDKELNLNAKEHIGIYPEIKYMFVDTMDSYDRNRGFGTCMHLVNIIEMLENDIDKIELYSTPSAVAFHIKCGFKPDSTWDDGLAINIQKIRNNAYPELKKYAYNADNLLKNLDLSNKDAAANQLLLDYISSACMTLPKEELKYLCSFPVHMKLTKQDILDNKNYYNNLFQTYKIDYQIT